MKVIATDIRKSDGEVLVLFECQAGRGVGKWSKGIDPQNGDVYDVELDIDKTITDLFLEKISELPIRSLMVKGDYLFISGLVEDVDGDGMAYFRISSDCLLMIECGETIFCKGEMITLKALSQDLLITAQGL